MGIFRVGTTKVETEIALFFECDLLIVSMTDKALTPE